MQVPMYNNVSRILVSKRQNVQKIIICHGTSRLLPKKIIQEPFWLPSLKVSSPSHFFKSPELINSSWDHNYLQESEDESSKAPVRATCSEIWLSALANKVPQVTGQPLGSNHILNA